MHHIFFSNIVGTVFYYTFSEEIILSFLEIYFHIFFSLFFLLYSLFPSLTFFHHTFSKKIYDYFYIIDCLKKIYEYFCIIHFLKKMYEHFPMIHFQRKKF